MNPAMLATIASLVGALAQAISKGLSAGDTPTELAARAHGAIRRARADLDRAEAAEAAEIARHQVGQ